MTHSGVPTPWRKAEGHIGGADIARRRRTLRGQRPCARTQAPRTGTGRSRVRLWPRGPQTASGSPRTHADDERAREVEQLRSTGEAAEQGRGAGRGSGGGKGAGQGKRGRAHHAPDSEPGGRVQRARTRASSSRTGQEAAVH